MVLNVLVCLIFGYAFGCFSTGYFVGKMHKIDDIRKYGSGNVGTTNALRTMGVKAGILTFLGDALKAIFAVLIAKYIFKDMEVDNKLILSLIAGFGAVLGHNFPFHLKFKGGKGIAVTAGVMLAFDWKFGLTAFLIFVSISAITKYVSLASLLLSLAFPICMIIFYENFMLLLLSICFTILAFVRHKDNIKRLLSKTERKLGQKVDINKG